MKIKPLALIPVVRSFGFSMQIIIMQEYEHRTNEGGSHASKIELLARKTGSGTGNSYLVPIITAKYNGNNPIVELDGDVYVKERNSLK